MSRWKAAGIHLILSIAIVATTVLFMLLVWYPWPLFRVAGAGRLIFILAAVDVTIGPLITLIIFKAGKRGLTFDLTVIALLQVAAIGYGMHTVYVARPVYMVFTLDRFDLVMAKDLDPKDLAAATRSEFRRLPLGRPRFIGVQEPTDLATRNRLLDLALQGKDIQLFPQYYVDYSTMTGLALARAKPLKVLRDRNSTMVDAFLSSEKLQESQVKFLPLRAPKVDGAVLLDAQNGAPLKILLIDPW
jgi:hypothetical protein